jgi:outer membrane cobalamin receptor
LLVTGLPSQAADLSGTVTDPAGARVAGATVNLYSAATLIRTARTGVEGTFDFPELASGVYLLECAQEGFQRQSRRLALSGTSESVTITLELAGLHQDVVVIASKLPELLSEATKSVSVIRGEELAERNAVLLTDAMLQVPALQLQQLGSPGSISSFRFRGLRPEDTAIVVDGFRFLDPSDNKGSARPLLSDLVLNEIDRVEVLRGAGSVLHGTNAIGGTVSMTSQQTAAPLRAELSLQGGSLGLFQASAGAGGRVGDRFSFWAHTDHVNYTRGIDEHDTYRNNSPGVRATVEITPQARVFAKLYRTDSFLFVNRSPSPLPVVPPLPSGQTVREAVACSARQAPCPDEDANFYSQFDDPDSHQRNRFLGLAVRLDHQVNDLWSYSAGSQGLRTRRRFDNGRAVEPLAQQLGFTDGGTATNFFEGELDQFFLRNSFALLPSNTLHAGFEINRMALDQTSFGLTSEAVQTSYAFTLKNDARLLGDRLLVQLAFEAQRFALDRPRFSDPARNPYASVDDFDIPSTYNGDASLGYLFASGTKVRIHAGNGYRSPALFERFGASGTSPFLSFFGSPLLHPERTTFIDGGIDQSALGNTLQLGATYFYTHLQTIIDFGSTPADPFGRSFGYFNRKGGIARGVELSASFRPARLLDLNVSYTLTKSQERTATSSGSTRSLGISEHQFSFGLAVRPTSRLSLHLQGNAISDYDFPLFGIVFTIPGQTYRFPGYAVLNLSGRYTVHEGERMKARWIGRVDNLLDNEYHQAGFLAPKATVRTGIEMEF